MTPWVYDIECYKHLFCITFIPLNVDQRLIDAYIAADLAGNAIDKARLLKAMGTKQFTIFNGIRSINQSMLILDFFKSHKVIYGYNSYNYDATILDIFLSNVRYFNETTGLNKNKQHICEFMFKHSDACVGYGKGYWKLCDFLRYFKRPFTDYDIQKILYLDKSFTGLKQVAICLRWYRIQQLPFAVHHFIQDSEVESVLDYNVNDVLITLTLIRSQKDELALRVELNEEFGNKLDDNYHVDFRNMSRSSIGKTITTKYYSMISKQEPSEFTDKRTLRYSIHLQDVISDKITFKTQPFKDLLKSIKESKIAITSDTEKAKWERTLLYNGTKYIVAKGGLHSKDNAIIYDNVDGFVYKDADVESYYPRIILNFRVSPAHLNKVAFLVTVDYVTTSRLKAKKAKQKTKAEGLKIAINRMYGAFKDTNDYLYDPEATYTVTFNGQLSLLMLVEDLELHGIHCISANTDGIVCRFKPDQLPIYTDCCERWQKRTDFILEFTDYERYLRNDVNNYIAIKKGFKQLIYEIEKNGKVEYKDKVYNSKKEVEADLVKRKGIFIEDVAFNKGFIHPVVPKALNAYLLYNIPIGDFIRNFITLDPKNIYDYCMAQKVDKSFVCEYHTISKGKKVITQLQQYNRFYVTDKQSGGMILKRKNNALTSILANHNVYLFNNYVEKTPEEYNINYGFYINQCNLILEGNIKKKGKPKGILGNSNNLFTTTNTDY